jgi:DNA-binding transcriptional MerR regulator
MTEPEPELRAEPPGEAAGELRMRIDDLAHESGITVDTIRYYQREGLLPPGAREGRHRVYGPDHLRRLTRIKELQARRFSIAAIRAFVSGDERRLEGVFTDEGEGVQYGYPELLERSGIDPEFAEALRAAGVLRDPQAFGRVAYDGDDLEMLRGMAELHAAGIPAKVLCELGRIYSEGVESMQRQVVDVFSDGTGVEWAPGEFDEFRVEAEQHGQTMLVSMRRLVDYTHHRTLQRLTLDRVDPGIVTPDDPTSELPI